MFCSSQLNGRQKLLIQEATHDKTFTKKDTFGPFIYVHYKFSPVRSGQVAEKSALGRRLQQC